MVSTDPDKSVLVYVEDLGREQLRVRVVQQTKKSKPMIDIRRWYFDNREDSETYKTWQPSPRGVRLTISSYKAIKSALVNVNLKGINAGKVDIAELADCDVPKEANRTGGKKKKKAEKKGRRSAR